MDEKIVAQTLVIVRQARMDCQVFSDGKHQNLNISFKQTIELADYITMLLSEGWRLVTIADQQLYFVCDPPSTHSRNTA